MEGRGDGKHLANNLMKVSYLLTLLLFAGCAAQPYEKKYPALHEVRTATRDPFFIMAELEGFRIEMTPRRVYQVMRERGYQEDRFSDQTIEDIIVSQSRYDLLSLRSSNGKRVTLSFCFKRLKDIAVSYDVATEEYDLYVQRDSHRLENKLKLVKDEVAEDRVRKLFVYEPNRFSHWSISYATDHTILETLSRSERVSDRLMCLRRELDSF